MSETNDRGELLSKASATRDHLGSLARRWCGRVDVPASALRSLVDAIGVLYALEVVAEGERTGHVSRAAKLIANCREELPPKRQFSLDQVMETLGATSQECPVEKLPELTVQIDDRSDSNFFTGMDGSLAGGGLFIATPKPLPVGTAITVKMQLPTAELETVGAVEWIDARPAQGMGVRLPDLDLAEHEPVLRVMAIREPLAR